MAMVKHLSIRKEIRLNKVFLEPENVGLKHIWRYGSADLVVSRHGKPVCIIESGGSHHWEEKQSLNDRRKWKLADINGVRCLTMMNGMMEKLSNRKWRELLGRYIFGTKETESMEKFRPYLFCLKGRKSRHQLQINRKD